MKIKNKKLMYLKDYLMEKIPGSSVVDKQGTELLRLEMQKLLGTKIQIIVFDIFCDLNVDVLKKEIKSFYSETLFFPSEERAEKLTGFVHFGEDLSFVNNYGDVNFVVISPYEGFYKVSVVINPKV